MLLLRAALYLAACAWLALALPAAGGALLRHLDALVVQARAGDAAARAFAAGAVAFLPLAWLLRAGLRFWYTLAHEMSHVLGALLLGGRPGDLEVRAGGAGRVTFARTPAVLWPVLLAPYVANPSYLVPLLVPALARDARVAGAAAAGLATAFALVANALQVRDHQSDIRRAGLVRSLLFITWGNLTAGALALALVTGGFAAAAGAARDALWP